MQKAKELKMATKISKMANSPMSTLKFNFEAMLIKDWVCLQCFQQDALEFEIIAFYQTRDNIQSGCHSI